MPGPLPRIPLFRARSSFRHFQPVRSVIFNQFVSSFSVTPLLPSAPRGAGTPACRVPTHRDAFRRPRPVRFVIFRHTPSPFRSPWRGHSCLPRPDSSGRFSPLPKSRRPRSGTCVTDSQPPFATTGNHGPYSRSKSSAAPPEIRHTGPNPPEFPRLSPDSS